MKRYSVFLASSLSILLLLSCEKIETNPLSEVSGSARTNASSKWAANASDETIGSEPVIRNGVMHFRDAEAYLNLKERFKGLTVEQRIKYTSDLKFQSLLSIHRKIEEELNTAATTKNINSFNELIEKYSPFISINSDSSIVYSIEDKLKSSFLNKDAVVYIGKYLYHYTNEKEEIVLDGDINKINKKGEAVKSFSINNAGMQSLDIGVPPSQLACPNGFEKTVYTVTGRYRDKLDVALRVDVLIQSNNLYSIVAYGEAVARAQLKTFFWQNSSGGTHTVYARWNVIGQAGFPLANKVYIEDTTVQSTALTLDYIGGSARYDDISNPSTVSFGLDFPGTGYYRGGYVADGVPMTCP